MTRVRRSSGPRIVVHLERDEGVDASESPPQTSWQVDELQTTPGVVGSPARKAMHSRSNREPRWRERDEGHDARRSAQFNLQGSLCSGKSASTPTSALMPSALHQNHQFGLFLRHSTGHDRWIATGSTQQLFDQLRRQHQKVSVHPHTSSPFSSTCASTFELPN